MTAPAGTSVDFPVSSATVVGEKAFFQLPSGTHLTEGQKYTVNVPAGAFKDYVGNAAAKNTANSFTVLSGSVSSDANGYSAVNTTTVTAGTGNATSDTVAPTVVSSYPKSGATDVPTSGVSVLMYFSEPVKFNDTGIISVVNGTAYAVAKLNLTSDTDKLKL